jgi:hypothetical protein
MASRSIIAAAISNHGSRNHSVRNGSRKSGPVKTRQTIPSPDFVVENHGSIFLLRPLTDAARNWLEEHIGQDNGYQPYFPTVVIDHSYISDIVVGIQNDGLVCR